MISISRLYCGSRETADALRYGRDCPHPSPASAFVTGRKPIVVWNCTQRCNLLCRHCYAESTGAAAPQEMTGDQARAMIDDLAAFRAPVLLFSGGEPLLREDLLDLIRYARQAGLRTVISTNGTRITPAVADQLARCGLNYAGISLDGLAKTNNLFRGHEGAFDMAMAGIANCLAAGVKVGLRLTMNRHNYDDIPGILDLVQEKQIPRICLYHLVYTGRGQAMREDTLTHAQTRAALDLILDRAARMHAQGHPAEILTVDNHADGPYLYLRMRRENHPDAPAALTLLQRNGGNSSGSGIACISWNGDVLPDQFWRHQVLGNVLQRPFSVIWDDPDQPLLAKLRDRKRFLQCRCMRCRWLGICNGNLRARAQAATGDLWGEDPACYLTDEEIS